MSAAWRAKLFVAVVIMALLALMSIVHGAVATHAWFEAQQSIAHWRGKLDTAPEGPTVPGSDSPARRIEGLEARAQQHVERLLLSAGLLIFSGTLAFLGARAYRNA